MPLLITIDGVIRVGGDRVEHTLTRVWCPNCDECRVYWSGVVGLFCSECGLYGIGEKEWVR